MSLVEPGPINEGKALSGLVVGEDKGEGLVDGEALSGMVLGEGLAINESEALLGMVVSEGLVINEGEALSGLVVGKGEGLVVGEAASVKPGLKGKVTNLPLHRFRGA